MKLLKTTLVAALLVSLQVHAITIENGSAKINSLSCFRLKEPSSTLTAVAAGGGIGGLIGALGGVTVWSMLVGKEAGLVLGLCAGLVAGGATGLYINYDYSCVYEDSEGLNMHGAAAEDNAHGIQALHEYAFKYGSNDYNIIGRDANGCTPLMYAAAAGSTSAAKMIIRLSPVTTKVLESTDSSTSIKTYKDIPTTDLTDNLKQTAAHYAVQTNHPGALKVLIKNGADLNLTDQHGRTPSMKV